MLPPVSLLSSRTHPLATYVLVGGRREQVEKLKKLFSVYKEVHEELKERHSTLKEVHERYSALEGRFSTFKEVHDAEMLSQ